ncbi:MAG TPA: hypothetical protein VIL20_01960 [Sandaracinaceae bacterium]
MTRANAGTVARSALWAALLGAAPGVVAAQPITVGPYTFPDESYFADDAVLDGQDVVGRWEPWLESGTHLLVGYSPDSGLYNLGCAFYLPDGSCATTRELLDFIFIDVRAVNGPGPDLVIFDARRSIDDSEVAVAPVGGWWSEYRRHHAADQRPTGVHANTGRLFGVDIDLSSYGVPRASKWTGSGFGPITRRSIRRSGRSPASFRRTTR